MIKLTFCNQRVLVWDPNDVSYLRKIHRIVGSFVGSMPGFAQQNSDLGLPLLLMPEEAKHLVDTGVAVVVQYELTINDEMKEFYTKLRHDFCHQNNEQFRADRVKAIHQMSDKIIAGKEKRFAQRFPHLDRKELHEEIIRQELQKIPVITAENCAIKVNTKCPFDKRVESVIDFSYPKTPKEVIRYEVFKDLWRKNYYITDGIKFGCDFLVVMEI
ncbi:unnamed protein product [Oppiella nova]|uniref:tRNA-intron lyase n=1 Tax=Oppiella nova TaxID=334625 RepID=A0A7R9ME32_9ACAR|nr:unnamed protein product [Oppiella nova]CAG2175682.1 unnamed protein product [Oppiella nova]